MREESGLETVSERMQNSNTTYKILYSFKYKVNVKSVHFLK